MSLYARLIRYQGRVLAVYRISGTTYVEIVPSRTAAWQAICDRVASMGAVAVKGDLI